MEAFGRVSRTVNLSIFKVFLLLYHLTISLHHFLRANVDIQISCTDFITPMWGC